MTKAGQILDGIRHLSALVVGDICLDHWCYYDPAYTEPSRETGIPRLAVTSREVTPGAGGTVANNLAALGVSRVAVLGVVGDDGHAFELRAALRRRRIQSNLLVVSQAIQTFTYTKLRNRLTGEEDKARVDFINVQPVPAGDERRVLAALSESAGEFDVVFVADQAETESGGVVSPAVRDFLDGFAEAHPEKVVWVDSRLRVEKFRNVLLKPNEREAGEACLRLFGHVDFQALRRHTGAPLMLVTHGPDGVLVLDGDAETWVPTIPVTSPIDICGAGDSFSAGAAMALRHTASPTAAAHFGNLVASITIMKPGTGTASPEEVLEAERRLS